MGRERLTGRRPRPHAAAIAPTLAIILLLALGAGTASAAPPNVDFSLAPGTARVGQSVGFTASASGNDGATIASLSWAFGDGATGSGDSVSHAYDSPGSKTVTLTATDSNGETASASHGVTVVGLPTAAFTWSPNIPNIGGSVSFNGNGSNDPGGAISSYAWSFGDGGTGSGATPSHAYATSGDKTVTLTITAALDGRTASVSHTVHVNVPPTASFVFAGVNAPAGQDPFTPVLGQQVAFSAQASGDSDGSVTSWAWDLGTGTFGAPASVSWLITTFDTAGNKDIRLQVTDDRGATAIATKRFRVNTPPVAAFDYAPTAPETGETVTFTSSASDGDGIADIASTTWDLNGDGTYGDATGPTAKAVFLTSADKPYTVREKVTDKGGATSVAEKQVTVTGPPAPPPTEPDPGNPPVVVPSPGAPVVLGFDTTVGDATTHGASPVAGTSSGPTKTVPLKALLGVRVRLAGSVTASKTKITRLVVVGPKGALVVVRCSGKGCPAKAVRRTIGSRGQIKVTTLKHALRSGAKITVSIAKLGYMTRRITLTMRTGRAPARSDVCVVADGKGKTKVTSCPAS